MREIVVTGLGAVCGCGWGVAAFHAGIRSGQAAIVAGERFDRLDHAAHRTHLASQVPPAPPGVEPRGARRSHADRFALAASREALRQAGLLAADAARPAIEPETTGVFFGTSTGGMLEAERAFRRMVAGARTRTSRFTSQPFNSPGDAVARDAGAAGPVFTISSACTSGALALAAALDALRSGEIDTALAGGSDELCELTYAGFNALRAVDPEPSRPFRAERQGLTLGEGAGVLVLETAERAAARGATPLARFVGAGSTCDAEHMTAPAQGGTGAARAIRRALADAGLAPDAVDFVDAHGTGTPLNDAAEWEAIAAVFGERASALPVTSTKGVVGHLLGAAGAIEAVATVLCLRAREVHPTPGAGTVDPAMAIRLVTGAPLPLPGARVALSTNLAFGGSNAALVFARAEDTR